MATNVYIELPVEGGSSGGVTSLNSLTGALSLVAGSGITVSPSGSDITIACTVSGTVTPYTASTLVERNSLGLIEDINPSQQLSWWDDFDTQNVNGTTNWGNNSTAGGSAQVQTPFSGDPGHIGIIQLETGTETTGVGNIYKDVSMFLGGATLDWEGLVQLSALSNSTDTYSVEIGAGNIENAEPYNGFWFSYSNGVNGGDWTANTGNGSTTSVDTGVAAAANAWVKLRMVAAANGSEVTFYINGTSVATISTTLPTTSATPFGHGLQIRKSAGTTGRTLYVDYVRFIANFTTAR